MRKHPAFKKLLKGKVLQQLDLDEAPKKNVPQRDPATVAELSRGPEWGQWSWAVLFSIFFWGGNLRKLGKKDRRVRPLQIKTEKDSLMKVLKKFAWEFVYLGSFHL